MTPHTVSATAPKQRISDIKEDIKDKINDSPKHSISDNIKDNVDDNHRKYGKNDSMRVRE